MKKKYPITFDQALWRSMRFKVSSQLPRSYYAFKPVLNDSTVSGWEVYSVIKRDCPGISISCCFISLSTGQKRDVEKEFSEYEGLQFLPIIGKHIEINGGDYEI